MFTDLYTYRLALLNYAKLLKNEHTLSWPHHVVLGTPLEPNLPRPLDAGFLVKWGSKVGTRKWAGRDGYMHNLCIIYS